MKQRRNESESAAVDRYEASLQARDFERMGEEDGEVAHWRRVAERNRAAHKRGEHAGRRVPDCFLCERS